MSLTLATIAALSPIEQAKTWAQVEDELLLDIDLGIGHGVTETDPVRVEAAWRLERAGVVFVRPAADTPPLRGPRDARLSAPHPKGCLMPKVQANIDIAVGDDMRVRPRQGGGFHVLIGPPGDHSAMLTFSDVAMAEALAVVLTTSAITHGSFGAAVAATSNVKPFPVRATPAAGPPLDAA